MEDFIKCAKCGKEECRAETFLDIPLAVKKRDGFESFANIVGANKKNNLYKKKTY